MYIPRSIATLVGDAPYTTDSIGKSGAAVLCYPEAVLKIAPTQDSFNSHIAMLRWLEDRLPAPKVLATAEERGMQYLLMSRIHGKMACDAQYTQNAAHLAELLAEALRILQAVDTTDCPVVHTLEQDLAEAEYRVAHGLVDVEDCEPETFAPGGFRDPEHLLHWLRDNKPEEEMTFCHGDLCLPNVFFEGDRLSGFIDLGDCGLRDKYRDLALCHRSLRHNISGRYAARPAPNFNPDILFHKLGITPDPEKLRYHVLLDELF